MMGLLETRHVRNAFKIMPVKTDRKDARGIVQLLLLGGHDPTSVLRQDSLLGELKQALLNRLMAAEFDHHMDAGPRHRRGPQPSQRRDRQARADRRRHGPLIVPHDR